MALFLEKLEKIRKKKPYFIFFIKNFCKEKKLIYFCL